MYTMTFNSHPSHAPWTLFFFSNLLSPISAAYMCMGVFIFNLKEEQKH